MLERYRFFFSNYSCSLYPQLTLFIFCYPIHYQVTVATFTTDRYKCVGYIAWYISWLQSTTHLCSVSRTHANKFNEPTNLVTFTIENEVSVISAHEVNMHIHTVCTYVHSPLLANYIFWNVIYKGRKLNSIVSIRHRSVSKARKSGLQILPRWESRKENRRERKLFRIKKRLQEHKFNQKLILQN